MTEENVNTETVTELGINDIAAVIRVIDIAAERGAFHGSELEAVGNLRGRMQTFVQANAPEVEE